MTISLRGTAVGLTAANDTTSPFAPLGVTLPTGGSFGDLTLLFVGLKPFSTDAFFSFANITNEFYVPISNRTSGTITNGIDTGSTRAKSWWKAHNGLEDNPLSITFDGQYSPSMRATMILAKTNPGNWTIQSVDGAFGTNLTLGNIFTSVFGGSVPAFTAGNWVVVHVVSNTDAQNLTSPVISIPGCTVGTATQRLGTTNTNNGNDGAMWVVTAPILSGTYNSALGSPILSSANSAVFGSETSGSFIRVIEPVATFAESWGMVQI